MTSYNNGKDLIPTDIRVVTIDPVKPSDSVKYFAYLGFITDWEPGQKHDPSKTKFYMAGGSTPEYAKADLIECLIDHLRRIQPKV